MVQMISITETEYNNLMEDSEFLTILEQMGVDNWEGYADAREAYLLSIEMENE